MEMKASRLSLTLLNNKSEVETLKRAFLGFEMLQYLHVILFAIICFVYAANSKKFKQLFFWLNFTNFYLTWQHKFLEKIVRID